MSEEEFTPKTYLADNKAAVIIAVICAAIIFGMSTVLGLNGAAAATLALTALVAFALALTVNYLRKRRFYRDMQECVASLDHAYYAPSLIDRPAFLEGQIFHDACTDIAQADAKELIREHEAARANREYAEAWAHEIKTPISASKLMVRRMHGPDVLPLRREIERIEDACERILFNARVTSLSADYRIQETNLAEVCREACKDLSALLIEKDTLPSVVVPDTVSVLADPHWLSFVFKQALSNAAKYGATTITFTCQDNGEGPHACTVLSITDNGIGIPASEVPHVFERSWSGTNGRQVGNSTGMGLYLASRACSAMGLGLALESEQGVGTCLSITFPHDRTRANLTGL